MEILKICSGRVANGADAPILQLVKNLSNITSSPCNEYSSNSLGKGMNKCNSLCIFDCFHVEIMMDMQIMTCLGRHCRGFVSVFVSKYWI